MKDIFSREKLLKVFPDLNKLDTIVKDKVYLHIKVSNSYSDPIQIYINAYKCDYYKEALNFLVEFLYKSYEDNFISFERIIHSLENFNDKLVIDYMSSYNSELRLCGRTMVLSAGPGNYFTNENRNTLLNDLESFYYPMKLIIVKSGETLFKVDLHSAHYSKSLENKFYLECQYLLKYGDSNDLHMHLKDMEIKFKFLFIDIIDVLDYSDYCNNFLDIKTEYTVDEAKDELIKLCNKRFGGKTLYIDDPRVLINYHNINISDYTKEKLLSKFKDRPAAIRSDHNIDLLGNEAVLVYSIKSIINSPDLVDILKEINDSLSSCFIRVDDINHILLKYSDDLIYNENPVEGLLDLYTGLLGGGFLLD